MKTLFRIPIIGALALLLCASSLRASDHADPIRLPDVAHFFDDGRPTPADAARLSGGITDLFLFPMKADGLPAVFPRKEGENPALTADEQAQIKAYTVILCVRRVLTKSPPVPLDGFVYSINFDLTSGVHFDDVPERARYGGSISSPDQIKADATIELRLKNDTTMQGKPVIKNPNGLLRNTDNIRVLDEKNLPATAPEIIKNVEEFKIFTGYRDDPFIFPPFFGSNVVCFVLNIPASWFPGGQRDFLAWATTMKDGKQIDHVGRSIRTQQPRFDTLNTLPPSKHVAALRAEEKNPSFMREVLLKLNIQEAWTLRPWDFVPDVMIYSNRWNVGFPNGRLLTDDVGALLARYGDTMILELSYLRATFPRATKNDKEFGVDFPYLASPFPDSDPRRTYQLSAKNKMILAMILAGVAVVAVLAVLGVAWIVEKLLAKKRRVEQA